MPSRPVSSGDHVVLVDGSSYIFRAFHALPPLTRPSDGLPVGAVSGFCNMLWKLLRDAGWVDPTHLAVIFDKSEVTFRKDFYADYKANRSEPPEDLIPQFPLIRHATRAFSIATLEQAGYEADDLIATYARLAAEAGAEVTIVGSDKDLFQLVGGGVTMLDPVKDKRIGPDEVFEKFGVGPEKMIDLQALAGDSVDNVPGVPGIGAKTAAQLLGEYGDLETLLERAHEIKQPKRRENLIANADLARISKRLVTLETNVPLDVPLDELGVHEPNPTRLVAFLKAMEFNTLTRRVAEATGVDIAGVTPDAEMMSAKRGAAAPPSPLRGGVGGGGDGGAVDGEAGTLDLGDGGGSPPPQPSPQGGGGQREYRPAEGRARKGMNYAGPSAAGGPAPAIEGTTPQNLADARRAEAAAATVDRSAYETITELSRLADWIRIARDEGQVAIDTETSGIDPMTAELVGVSLALAPGIAAYIPLGHVTATGDLLSEGGAGGGLVPGQISAAQALALLKDLLEDASVLKIGQGIKYDLTILDRLGIRVAPYDDTMLMSYALDSGLGAQGLDELSRRHLGHAPITYDEVTGTGRARKTFAEATIEKASAYAAEDADLTFRLWRLFKARLVAERMTGVYETLERPMPAVLSTMEQRGVVIERAMLSRLSGELAQRMGALEADIHALAGEPFNLGSPKQLGDILFGKMQLPGAKKTKTGAWATPASILEDLATQGHDLPRRILDWRQLAKLKSTYADALPAYVHAETHRVHTTYQLAATTTGRLSSTEPNLQNIPVRTEEGRKIRRAFVAPEGKKIVSADYSQIELRLLAHMADIPQLRQAFADGLDIHAMTASEMFGVPVEGMDSSTRRRAKAINFGIIYGISAFGLANQLGIGREEAGLYIKTYFERFPGIRDYMEATKEACRRDGYVKTLFGRKCHYPSIRATNPAERAFNERAAINAPLQGSAADIIRRAMIRMDSALAEARLGAKMLLQVHDELIFEVDEAEVAATLPVISQVMEEAPLPALALKVPLQVDARAAGNWDEAH
ncbi:DNA polymerase I [Methylopila sp. M107]|uniref:DNA polymerase I n=1 Tax=Methylopila sp. M107 TaxID=1101190 RepID=UPI0003607B67|nr:DNA polymerase I [Methylopila sp. M107]